jgi:hypothetical protein
VNQRTCGRLGTVISVTHLAKMIIVQLIMILVAILRKAQVVSTQVFQLQLILMILITNPGPRVGSILLTLSNYY